MTIKARDAIVSRVQAAHSAARAFKLTSADLNARVYTAMHSEPKATLRDIAYCEGYQKALVDVLYERYLVFGGVINGRFYSTHSNRADYYAKNGIEPNAFADDGAVTARGHYWAGDNMTALSPPFFLSKP